MRTWSIPVAGLLTVVLVGAGAPAVAQAAEIRHIAISNSNYDGANPGVISITVDTDEPVRAIHADFVDQETGETSGTADDFVLVEQAGTRLQYATASPVVMQPGDYDVRVAVTDAAGEVQHAADWIRYDVLATIENLTVDPSTIDYDHRDVTVTGVLKGRWPGTGEVRPIAGAVIGYWVHLGGDEPIVTAADGTFRRTFTMSGAINIMQFWYASGSAHTTADRSVDATVSVAPQQTRVSLRADKRRAVVGAPVTLSGKVERRSGRTWVPVTTPEQIMLWFDTGCDESGCASGFNDVQIDADGGFRVQTPAERTGYFRVSVIGHLDFLAGSVAQTRVVTVVPAR